MSQPDFDPIGDAEKEFSIDEFVALAKSELDKWAEEWRGVNEFHRQGHTWNDWFRSFLEYMSW